MKKILWQPADRRFILPSEMPILLGEGSGGGTSGISGVGAMMWILRRYGVVDLNSVNS